jgi:hypothetical protein
MFNILLLNACSLGITEYSAVKMKSYTQGKTYLYEITVIFEYSYLMRTSTQINLFGLVMLALSGFTCIYNLVFGGYRLKFSKLEKQFNKDGMSLLVQSSSSKSKN